MSFEDLASSLFHGFAPEMFDFDLFDKDQDAVETEFALNHACTSPASGTDYGSPKSTESEQSEALDVPDVDKEIEGLPSGITHDHTDIFKRDSPLLDQSFLSHGSLLSDPTMMSTFPGFSDSVDLLGLLNTALGQANNHYEAPPPTTSAQPEVAFGGISPEWLSTVSSPVLPSPSSAQLPNSQSSTKRKASEDSDVSVAVKKPRGRPPKAKVTSLTPSRRPSNPSPLSKTVTFPEDDASSDTGSTKHTVSGESSTARPKAVVPLKYLKDPKSAHSAQMILGMSAEQILSYATFDLLLRDVDPSRLEAAEEFGEKLAGGRDKAAKDAARARADRKNKVETLERQVAGLESKLDGVQAFLQGLVSQGFVSADQVAILMA